jgi:hypothetical protein
MTEANLASEITPVLPAWQRVPELADLTEIFEPGVQLWTWQREIDPAIGAYLSELDRSGELQRYDDGLCLASPRSDCSGPGRCLLGIQHTETVI